jgi:hypothetical protein
MDVHRHSAMVSASTTPPSLWPLQQAELAAIGLSRQGCSHGHHAAAEWRVSCSQRTATPKQAVQLPQCPAALELGERREAKLVARSRGVG